MNIHIKIQKGYVAMLNILHHHGFSKASWVGHSFGTFFLSHLNRRAPESVASMTLIDPVCMCMWSGHLVRSFVYRCVARVLHVCMGWGWVGGEGSIVCCL